jgi:hypothetical protein
MTAKLVRALAPDWCGMIRGDLNRPAELGPSISGPLRPARHLSIELRFAPGKIKVRCWTWMPGCANSRRDRHVANSVEGGRALG